MYSTYSTQKCRITLSRENVVFPPLPPSNFASPLFLTVPPTRVFMFSVSSSSSLYLHAFVALNSTVNSPSLYLSTIIYILIPTIYIYYMPRYIRTIYILIEYIHTYTYIYVIYTYSIYMLNERVQY